MDPNEIFNIVADSVTGEGEPLISRTELELAAGIAGAIGFAFKDHLGRVVLPTLTTDGKLPTTDTGGIKLRTQNTVLSTGNNIKDLVATVVMLPSKQYTLKLVSGASTQTVVWALEQLDGETVSGVHKWITGAGKYTEKFYGDFDFTSSASGPQEVNLYGTQTKGQNSNLHGTICLQQVGA